MEYRTKVIITSWIAITLSLILIVFCWIMLKYGNGVFESRRDLYDTAIEATKASSSVFIAVYGDECNFRRGADYRMMSSITDEALADGGNYQHTVIIINDINGKAELSENDFTVLKKRVSGDNCSLYYFGSRYLKRFSDEGIADIPTNEGTRGFMLSSRNGKPSVTIWTDKNDREYATDKEYLGRIIFINIYKSMSA